MKTKNAVVGTRVRIKKGVDTNWYRTDQTGVIEKLSDDDDCMYDSTMITITGTYLSKI